MVYITTILLLPTKRPAPEPSQQPPVKEQKNKGGHTRMPHRGLHPTSIVKSSTSGTLKFLQACLLVLASL